MTKRAATLDRAKADGDVWDLPPLPKLPESVPREEVAKLLAITAQLLEVSIALTGAIDPASGWLVAHAADEFTLGVYGERRTRA